MSKATALAGIDALIETPGDGTDWKENLNVRVTRGDALSQTETASLITALTAIRADVDELEDPQ